MTKYRSREEVEAKQLTGSSTVTNILQWGNGAITAAVESDTRILYLRVQNGLNSEQVRTDDWVLKDKHSQFRMMRNKQFKEEYQEVKDDRI